MSNENSGALSRPLKWFYILVVIALAFSGFGQMPIFKRYYLADIPGMAWAADFYTTLMIHYTAAALFLVMTAYLLVNRILAGPDRPRLVWSARIRIVIFSLLIITGTVLVLRNLPGFVLPPKLIVASTFTHIGSAMLYVLASATYFRLAKSK
jgi:heme A synthase